MNNLKQVNGLLLFIVGPIGSGKVMKALELAKLSNSYELIDAEFFSSFRKLDHAIETALNKGVKTIVLSYEDAYEEDITLKLEYIVTKGVNLIIPITRLPEDLSIGWSLYVEPLITMKLSDFMLGIPSALGLQIDEVNFTLQLIGNETIIHANFPESAQKRAEDCTTLLKSFHIVVSHGHVFASFNPVTQELVKF